MLLDLFSVLFLMFVALLWLVLFYPKNWVYNAMGTIVFLLILVITLMFFGGIGFCIGYVFCFVVMYKTNNELKVIGDKPDSVSNMIVASLMMPIWFVFGWALNVVYTFTLPNYSNCYRVLSPISIIDNYLDRPTNMLIVEFVRTFEMLEIRKVDEKTISINDKHFKNEITVLNCEELYNVITQTQLDDFESSVKQLGYFVGKHTDGGIIIGTNDKLVKLTSV